ncbi:hypothetical protein TUM4438_40680 [Shewanella sairae]|uniref:Calx-beta domain-containing protein n=1 Tax=Shewanella sairae TaxID=190310 RepID=A0ABQ4PQE2_9GAMM|nr:hypothetical protein [Shewanella sairae]MCL1132314.1 hypothetical protein [Shewanella sairae]GIU51356.1 hypothetical protein TUM4438_40680 [Shewanella sairae]
MKKVFNASILAAAVAMSFGANAAQILVSPADKMELSAEGISVGVTVADAPIVFDTVLDKDHVGTTQMVVTLGDAVNLTNITGGSCGAPVTGTFTCGEVIFNVGTGSFTFDTVAVDADKGTVTYTVSLGNTITAGSSYRTTIGDSAFPIISDEFSASFASDLAGTPVDAGAGVVATKKSQYAIVITEELSKVIERSARMNFVGETANASTDTFTLDVTDLGGHATPILAKATTGDLVLTVAGDFSAANGETDVWVNDSATPVKGVVAADAKSLTFTVPAAMFADVTGKKTINFTFDKADSSAEMLVATGFTATGNIAYTGAAAATGNADYLKNGDAGEWRLDAAVINVPYLPVGFGLSPNVEVANDSSVTTKSEIIIEGFDQNGVQYGPVALPTLANGKTVTKVSEADIEKAFGLAAASKTKLSVTFIIDADADKVTLAPYYRQNESRVNVMSDQYKADSIR